MIGPYEVVARLTASSHGEVYRVFDTLRGREVALKMLSDSVDGDPQAVERFQKEARLAGSLNHPNLLKLYDVGEHERKPFLVSELLEGKTLRELLAQGPLPRKRALTLGLQLAQGLSAAHEKGIVHGELKAENIFVTADGRAKILDFGLAKLRAFGSEKPPMSPEQIRGAPADARSDLFSLGCVLYEMLRGRRPFAGNTSDEVGAAILRDPPQPLEKDAPAVLTAFMARCLQKSPAARFQTAAEVAAQLAQCMVIEEPAIAGPGAYSRLNALADVLGRPVGEGTARMALRDLTPSQEHPKATVKPAQRPKHLTAWLVAVGLAFAAVVAALIVFGKR